MAELSQQWPLLAGFLILATGLLRVVQSLYEARLRDWQTYAAQAEERARKAEERAAKAEGALRELTDLLEAQGSLMADSTSNLKTALAELERKPRPRAP